jgi:hypothetical protein
MIRDSLLGVGVVMRGWDINARRWRDVPEDRWTVEWHTAPVRPAGVSDEDWQLEIDCNGHDLAICHAREFASEQKARVYARSVLKQDWYGSVLVQREVPDFVEGSAFFWEPSGETIHVDGSA